MDTLYELVSMDDYEGLPDEPHLKFIAFEAICRASMTRLITENTTRDSDNFIRLQYMTEVSGAAEATGIDGVHFPSDWSEPINGFSEFLLAVSRQTALIKLVSQTGPKAYSVRLAEKTRGRLEQQIEILRNIIRTEVSPEGKAKSLLKKLDELSTELGQNRVSLAKVGLILALVSTALVQGAAFFADAPQAIATIHYLLGADKEAEEREVQRLGPPPKQKALPPKANEKSQQMGRQMTDIIDDDIPF